MKRTLAAIGGIALLSGGAAAVSQNAGGAADGAPVAAESAAAVVSRGASAWAESCSACHNLRSPAELDDVQWRVAATHMRVRANLPGNVTRDIIAFLQASNGGPQPAAYAVPAGVSSAASASSAVAATSSASAAASADPVAGGRIYATTCVACHGPNGTGALPGAPDFTAANGRLAKSDDVLLRNMTNGFQSPGSPMPMPARGGNPDLTDQDMANVLAYIRTTFGE